MPTPPPPYYARLHSFRQADFAGQPLNPAWIDSELDRIVTSLNQTITLARGITDATGRLKLQQPLREMRLIEVLTYTATAGQTQFYVAPIFDALTDRAQVRLQDGTTDLFETLDQTKVAVAMAVAAGDVTASTGSNVYTFTTTVPDPVVGATLTINGTDAGIVTARLSATQVQTTTPWPLANGTTSAPSWAWGLLGVVTITPSVALLAGQKVQIDLFSDGAGALSLLDTPGSTTGARLVAIYDAAGLLGASNVEDALQELASIYNSLVSDLGPLTDYIQRDGSVAMIAPFDFGNQKGVNLYPASAPGEAVEYSQFAAFVGVWNNLQAYYLKLDGSTPMGGPLNMGGKEIINVATGSAANSAATVAQVDTRLPLDGSSPMTGPLNMGGKEAINAAPGTTGSSLATVAQVTSLITGGATLAYMTAVGNGQTFTVPAGVTRLHVQMWGGGGGGGDNGSGECSGGGSGAYCESILEVTSGEQLDYDIGAGGAKGFSGTTTEIRRGATMLMRATGGGAGAGPNNPGIGGTPQTGGPAAFGISGSPGRAMWQNVADGQSPTLKVGGEGGDAPRGGAGGRGYTFGDGAYGGSGGTPGLTPGGGGSSNYAGAPGAILFRY